MSAPENSAALSAGRLCLACGLCCNGVLFHLVRLQPADSARDLAALGMKLKKKKGVHHFSQPCSALSGTCCTLYTSRPERCRLFECRQLRGLAAGQVTEAEAAGRIRDVQARVTRVEALLAASENIKVKQPLSERYGRVLAEPCHPDWNAEAVALRQELTREMTNLNDILNRDFRLEDIPLPQPAAHFHGTGGPED